MSVVHVQAVNLTRLRLNTQISALARSVVEYPMVEILRNRVFIVANPSYIAAGAVISRYNKSL